MRRRVGCWNIRVWGYYSAGKTSKEGKFFFSVPKYKHGYPEKCGILELGLKCLHKDAL